MMQRMRVIAVAGIATVFVSYADARPLRHGNTGLRTTPVCATDSPHFAARAQWRFMRTDTLSEAVELRQVTGLVDVPIDSIDYERDDVKCAKVVAELNSYYSITDSTKMLRKIVLISWGGRRFLARVNNRNWAVFDSTQTFLEVLTTL